MTVTLSTRKTYALPSDAVPLTVSASEAGANLVRLFLTKAPEGSTLADKLAASKLDEIPVTGAVGWTVGAGKDTTQHVLNLDRGGVYHFVAHEYAINGSSYGGGYAGDPAGIPTETKLSENTVTVAVGQRMTQPVGAAPYGSGTLVVWIWGDTVRATTLAEHGEATPAIINVRGERMASAIAAADTAAALSALADVTASDLTSGMLALYIELRTDMVKHMSNDGAAFHGTADSDNIQAIRNLPNDPGSPEGWATALSILATQAGLHMTNSTSTGSFGAQRYHVLSGGDFASPDTTNCLAVRGGSGQPHLNVMTLAAIRRAWVAHIGDTSFHAFNDTNNPITSTVPPLLALHEAIFDKLCVSSPTGDPLDNPGVAFMRHFNGFATG